MKISICSDMHLEFGYFDPVNKDGADVLIISGDLFVAADFANPYFLQRTTAYRTFLNKAANEFKHVLYVAGNHEFYHSDYAEALDVLASEAEAAGVTFLHDKAIVIDGVMFIGSTLWTNMNKHDPITMLATSRYMNDYRVIRYGEGKLQPKNTVEMHVRSMQAIEAFTNGFAGDKVVVLTHHAPSKQSTHPRYKDDVEINGAYSSDHDEFMLDHPKIVLWTHGHTHEDFDYMVGNTRVVANPRGYIGYEDKAHTFDFKTVEI